MEIFCNTLVVRPVFHVTLLQPPLESEFYSEGYDICLACGKVTSSFCLWCGLRQNAVLSVVRFAARSAYGILFDLSLRESNREAVILTCPRIQFLLRKLIGQSQKRATVFKCFPNLAANAQYKVCMYGGYITMYFCYFTCKNLL